MNPLLFSWITKTHLLLTLASVTQHPAPHQNLWFSQDGIVRAETNNQKILLRAKQLGRVFAHGLGPTNELITIDVIAAVDFPLYQSCARKFFDLSASPPLYLGALENLESTLKLCPLSSINLSWADSNPEQERLLNTLDQKLKDAGIRFERSQISGLRPLLRVEKGNLNQAHKALGALSTIVAWEERVAKFQPGRTLLMEMGLVEISHSKISSLGASLPTKLNFRKLPTGLNLDPQSLASLGINFQNIQGLGKVLAQPRLRVRPGQKASFQSGGEIPVAVKGPQSQGIEWKPYGLILGIEPSAEIETGAQQIRVNFEIEMSEPDTSLKSDSTPAIKQSKLKSSFDLRTNELSVLGSLFQSRSSESKEGPWGLSSLPFLGGLFSKNDHMRQTSELWIVVKASWEEIPIGRFSQLESKTSHGSP